MDRTSFSKICTLLGLASVVLVVGSSLMGVPAFVLGAVLAVACFVFGLMARKEDGSRKISGGIMFGVMAIFVLLAIAGMSTVQVAAGEKGVIVSSPSGNIGEVIDEGWHFDPAYSFATVENIRYNTQTVEYIGYDDDIDTVGGISVLTKDSLVVDMDIAVTFHIPPEMVKKLRFEYGSDWKITILHQEVRSVPRLTCVNYTALEIISDKRPEVESAITTNLSNQIMDRCGGCVIVDKVIIREMRIPQAMSEAVEQKLISQQQLEKAKIDLERVQVEAEASKAAVDKVRESFDSDEAYLKYILYETLKDMQGVQIVLSDSGTATVKVV
ncbi:MAG: prohibitin family protein [Candidatus Methanomethylophilaceae archaeon]|nr:prohibitin family protein [Candidatus Methanomethylophilaceae archaeon]MBR3409232.1 prohibitin family protein [Candidatus Methanomethylophilaceae archaeon]MBR3476494.1 prohibitin family protein [Candidatus Methanomethylophilaceae archaeon]